MLGGRDVCARIYDLKFYRRRRRDPLNRLFRNLQTITQQDHSLSGCVSESIKEVSIDEHEVSVRQRGC